MDEEVYTVNIRNLAFQNFDSKGNLCSFQELKEEMDDYLVSGIMSHATNADVLKLICEQNRFRLTRFTKLSGDDNELFHIIPIVEKIAVTMKEQGTINDIQYENLIKACNEIRKGFIMRYGVKGDKGIDYCIPYVMSFTRKDPSDPSTWVDEPFKNKDLFIQIIINGFSSTNGGIHQSNNILLKKVKYDHKKIEATIEKWLTNLFYEGNEVRVETLAHLIVDLGIQYKPSRYMDEEEMRIVVMVPYDDLKNRIINNMGPIPLNSPCLHGDFIGDAEIENEFSFELQNEEIPNYIYINPFKNRLGHHMVIFTNPGKNPDLKTPGWSIVNEYQYMPSLIHSYHIEKD